MVLFCLKVKPEVQIAKQDTNTCWFCRDEIKVNSVQCSRNWSNQEDVYAIFFLRSIKWWIESIISATGFVCFIFCRRHMALLLLVEYSRYIIWINAKPYNHIWLGVVEDPESVNRDNSSSTIENIEKTNRLRTLL